MPLCVEYELSAESTLGEERCIQFTILYSVPMSMKSRSLHQSSSQFPRSSSFVVNQPPRLWHLLLVRTALVTVLAIGVARCRIDLRPRTVVPCGRGPQGRALVAADGVPQVHPEGGRRSRRRI